MIKLAGLNVIGTVALAAATLVADPVRADDPGANPVGKWSCVAAGSSEPAGVLTMTETDYAFAETLDQVSGSGGYRIERNFIAVSSGPLKDPFGLAHAHLDTRLSPLALIFYAQTGRGMVCNPLDL